MSGTGAPSRHAAHRWVALGGVTAALAGIAVGVMSGDGAEPARRPTVSSPPAPTPTPAPTAPAVTSASTTAPTTTSRPPAAAVTTDPPPGEPVGGPDDYAVSIDVAEPALAGRTVPDDIPVDEPPPSTIAPPPWAAGTMLTPAGHVSTDVGCADGLGHTALDTFLAGRVGPVLGWDYQHVYPLGGDRYLWLFQDTFLDHSGTVHALGGSRFVHNAAMVQDGSCFRLLHRGSPDRPLPFEEGDGLGGILTKWFWPMGGELADGVLWVFWAEMVKDPYDPEPPDGLGWHPARTFLARYDAVTLERLGFGLAPDSGVTPIYGYAVSSDATHTYLFGNTFEQNFIREGGFWAGPHSASHMYVARVPRGRVDQRPEYWSAAGWTGDAAARVPILSRFWAENPMQPRYLDGQWVAATAVDGYWGDLLAVDVADSPTGPWSNVYYAPLEPRGADPLKNTYHAHLLPWRDGFGSFLITVSNNARNMRRDAWNAPHRYRPMATFVPHAATPPPTTTTTPPTTPPTTTTSTTTASTTTTTTTITASTTTTTTASTTTTTTASTTTTTTASTTTTTAPAATTTTTTTTP